MAHIANINVGRPDVSPSAPSHTLGVREGNWPNRRGHYAGFRAEGMIGHGSARRSTGINPDARNPIDPTSPNLSPS